MDSLLQISKTGHSAEGVKVLPPVSAIQIGKSNGRSAVDHHAVADIKAAMRNAAHVITHGSLKEDDIARLSLVIGNLFAQTSQPFRAKATGIVHAAVGEHIAHKARTVKAGFR